MATNKKTDFVENYPYLVYAPDAGTIASEGGGGSSTCVFYAVERYNNQLRQPQGTFSVGETEYQSTTTASLDGLTVYGYEVPFGALVTYTAPTGLVNNADIQSSGSIYPSMDELESDGDTYGVYFASILENPAIAVFFPSPTEYPMVFTAELADA